ncbi:MAG: hypothetical protein HYV60_07575, partial [Planctomycetia bacterium]|nr:hypothetical protein [Planctomycetia bacterium]
MTSILETAVSNVLLAATLAIMALVVSRLWKNPHVAHLLWVIVLAKLVTPPLWNVPMPVAGLFHASAMNADGNANLKATSFSATSTPIETVYDLSDDPAELEDDPTADAATT